MVLPGLPVGGLRCTTPLPTNGRRPSVIPVLIQNPLECPALSVEQLASLCDPDVGTITRHIDQQYLESARAGYFQFGTIVGYKATEKNAGRFGDEEEGSQQEAFHAQTGHIVNLEIGTGQIGSVTWDSGGPGIVLEYIANDYCSCSSIGSFRKERAETIRSKENPTLGAFVTYDLEKLMHALLEIAKETPRLADLHIIGRRIEYGTKDRNWEISDNFVYKADRDHLSIWLDTAFIKPSTFQHEEEFRMLLVDRAKLGRLPEEEPVVVFNDPRIAEAIIDSGEF